MQSPELKAYDKVLDNNQDRIIGTWKQTLDFTLTQMIANDTLH